MPCKSSLSALQNICFCKHREQISSEILMRISQFQNNLLPQETAQSTKIQSMHMFFVCRLWWAGYLFSYLVQSTESKKPKLQTELSCMQNFMTTPYACIHLSRSGTTLIDLHINIKAFVWLVGAEAVSQYSFLSFIQSSDLQGNLQTLIFWPRNPHILQCLGDNFLLENTSSVYWF